MVNGAQQHLKLAAEAEFPDQRQSRLDRAYEVLMRAIAENNQGDNPAVWYYLGRYYVEQGDAPGADSSFGKAVEMLPDCANEAREYLSSLYPDIRTGALREWQEGNIDSATVLFHLGRSLAPDDAELLFFMSMMYTSQDQLDSATKYMNAGVELAAGDPTLEDRQRQTMLDVARGHERVAFEDPAVNQIIQSRMGRDTLVQAVERDSVRLTDLIQQWSGQNLRPDVQEAVQRDSTMLADRLASARTALAGAAEAYVRDSSAATAAFANALQAYEGFLRQYPDDAETLVRLIRRYSMLGLTERLEELIPRATSLEALDVSELAQLGGNIFNDGFPRHAASVLEPAVARNPYSQNTLYLLTRVYYSVRDGDKLLATARQLMELDPLNAQGVRMLAAAWDLAGHSDSVAKYVALADTGLGWSVTVTQFLPTESAAVLNGSVANISLSPLGPMTLVFEFLGADGSVLATSTADVPALESRRRHSISIRADVGHALGWRYRRQ
jgi:tetratricopeptide (TPR) repeat protein